MNDKGMTAFVDAMVFLIVIMMAISLTASYSFKSTELREDPDDILTVLSGTELRLSDLTDVEDDALVYLVDIMALSFSESTRLDDYLYEILDGILGKGRYSFTYSMGDLTRTLGDDGLFFRYQDTKELRASTGESLVISLSIC